MKPTICVYYRETVEDTAALRYAAELTHLTQAGVLHVYVTDLSSFIASGSDIVIMQRKRVVTAIGEVCKLSEAEIEIHSVSDACMSLPLPEGAILVSSDSSLGDDNAHRLIPHDESSPTQKGEGPIFIPFGDGPSGRVAAQFGLEFAQMLGRSVALYHTTWFDDRVGSMDPANNMCSDAVANRIWLEQECSRRGLAFEFFAEMAPEVVPGFVRAAMRCQASLIVVSRGLTTLHGSYATMSGDESPIPVLIVSNQNPAPASVSNSLSPILQNRPTTNTAPSLRRQLQALFVNPYVAVAVAFASNALKSICKVLIGMAVKSPLITSDGLHNISDVVESLAMFLVLGIARRPKSDKFPYGRAVVEFIVSSLIGLILLAVAFRFGLSSSAGILAYFPSVDHAIRSHIGLPTPESVLISGGMIGWVLAITIGSVLISRFVGRYQIKIGNKTKHASLIACGEEMANDSLIEVVTVVGVLGEFLFHAPWVDYVFAFFVAVWVGKAGLEMVISAGRVIMQPSIGEEHENAIRRICQQTAGIIELVHLKTVQLGHTALITPTLTSRRNAAAIGHIQYAIQRAVSEYITTTSEFKDCDVHVRVDEPPPDPHREAFAVFHNGDKSVIALGLEDATHIIISDVRDGRSIRATLEPVTRQTVHDLLETKRVTDLFVLRPDQVTTRLVAPLSIIVHQATSYLPETVMGPPPR